MRSRNYPPIEKYTTWTTVKSGVRMRYSLLQYSWDDSELEGTISGSNNDLQTLFICIPGNPGNELFYELFGEVLLRAYFHQTGHKRAKFFAIAHANHVPFKPAPSGEDENSYRGQHSKRFNLEDQVRLKLEFFSEFLPGAMASSRVFLIGHSIGAYIALRIMPSLASDGWNIAACYCLFPTVEDMALTPNGQRLGPLVKFAHFSDFILRWIFSLLNCCLPHSFKEWFVRQLLGPIAPKCVHKAAIELIDPLVARNIAHMAFHELEEVKEFDPSFTDSPLLNRVIFFYGLNDDWAPVEFAERMANRMPKIMQVIIDRSGLIKHAFVLRNSWEMVGRVMRLVSKRIG